MNPSESLLVTFAKKPVLVVTLGVSVGGLLAIPNTSSAEPNHIGENRVVFPEASTSSGFGEVPLLEELALTENQGITTRRAISEIRQISGLTWEELGRLFHVSRRSVHFWASGKPLRSGKEVLLLRTLDFIRKVDRGNARDNRSAIFLAIDGRTPFDLISKGNFTEAENLLGIGTGRKKLPNSRLDRTEKILRSPLPPEQLVDAMNDRIHRASEKGRVVRTKRIKQREIE